MNFRSRSFSSSVTLTPISPKTFTNNRSQEAHTGTRSSWVQTESYAAMMETKYEMISDIQVCDADWHPRMRLSSTARDGFTISVQIPCDVCRQAYVQAGLEEGRADRNARGCTTSEQCRIISLPLSMSLTLGYAAWAHMDESR